MLNNIMDWFDERIGLRETLAGFLDRKIPKGVNWWYTFGSATLFLFIIQVVTGILLAMHYSASPDHAMSSLDYIMKDVAFGSVIRGLHHWAASGMILLVFFHLLRVFFFGSYKYPRELSWLAGVVILVLVLGFGFTGYLLPWSQKSYWATMVGTNIAGTAPFFGALALKFLRGGSQLGAVALARFYAIHTLILPTAAAAFIGLHLYLVVKQGISAPPEKPGEPPVKRENYAAAYAAAKKEGESFFPYTLFKDAVVMLVVFAVIFYLAIFLKIPAEEPAKAVAAGYVPRPEWYFLWLFQLLWFFKGPLEVVGTFFLPATIILILFLLPFYDRNPARSLFKRPIALILGLATVLGIVYLTYQGASAPLPKQTALQIAKGAPEGQKLFAQQGCSNCHSINKVGGSLGPDLTHFGGLNKDNNWLMKFLKNPAALKPDTAMPGVELPEAKLKILIEYLRSLK